MSDCRTCGHPERWHQTETQVIRQPLTHCNEWGCKCTKFEGKK